MDAKTGRVQAVGWPATYAAAGIVTVAFASSCAKESHPEGNRREERVSANRSLTPVLYVHVEDGAVTVRARDAALERVLDRIAVHGGLHLVAQGRLDERVTVELHSLPLRVALRELLRDRSFVLMDAQGRESAGDVGGGALLILSDPSSRSIAPAAAGSRIRDESIAPDELHTVEDLRVALADPDSNARMDAVSALGDLDDEQVPIVLASVASEDTQPSVRMAALHALAGRQTDAKNPAFTRALNDVDSDVRKAAIGALERIGSESSARTLSIALKDRDASVRATAVDALGEIGGDAARSLIELALKDEDELVREMAAAQLEEPRSAQ